MRKIISFFLVLFLSFGLIIPSTISIGNAETEINLFSNPGVEDDTSWENYGNTVRLEDPDHAHGGNYTLRIGKDDGSSGGSAAVFTYNITPGKTYIARAWGKSESENTAAFSVVCADTSLNFLLQEHTEGYFSSSYEEKSVTFTAPEDTAVIGIMVSKTDSPGFAWFDDFSLVEAAEEEPGEVNLIEDPSFEEGTSLFTSGEDGTEIIEDADNARTGAYLVRMGDEAGRGGLGQITLTSLVPGKTYRASAWGKVDTGTASFVVVCFDSSSENYNPFGPGLIGEFGPEGGVSYNGSYTEIEITFTVPEDTVAVGLTVWKGGGEGYAYFDDFSLVEVAEEEEPGEPGEPDPGETVIPDTPTKLYVALDGDDSSEGTTIEAPLATLEAARDKIRSAGVPEGGVTVYVRGGTYYRTSAFQLIQQDSGTPENPIIYSAYPGETVLFTGAVSLDNSKFMQVTDPVITSRLPNPGKVMVYDLKSDGIPTGKMPKRSEEAAAPELFIDNVTQVLARYPNVNKQNPEAEYMPVSSILVNGASGEAPIIGYTNERIDHWAQETDGYLFGYFIVDWLDATIPIAEIDTAERTIEFAYAPGFGVGDNGRYYGLNLLCELDNNGEYYIDRTEVDGQKIDKLYLYVENGLGENRVEITVLESELLNMNRADNVIFNGIDFSKSQNDLIKMINCKNSKIVNSEISMNSGWGINIQGGSVNVVDGCYIHDTGTGGVRLDGGNFTTLAPSNHIVQNSEFEEYSRIKRTYTPAVDINGVGQIVRRNYIHDAPHSGILFTGNDHLIEFNEISNVLYETGDAGAIYSGRDWTRRGNVIRYNYIHDIPNPSSQTYGIYLDDAYSSVEIYGNIFEDLEYIAVFVAGGRENIVYDNIYINVEGGAYLADARTFDEWYDINSMVGPYNAKPINNSYWATKYPELAATYGHLVVDKGLRNVENPDLLNPMYPAGNKIYNEALVDTRFGSIVPMIKQLGEIDDTPDSYVNTADALNEYHLTLKNTTSKTAKALNDAKATYLSRLTAAGQDIIKRGTPTIDGNMEPAYLDSIEFKFNPNYNTAETWGPTDKGNNTGSLYALWDEEYLYIYALVSDSQVMTQGSEHVNNSENPWDNDAVEVYINSLKVSIDAFGERIFTHQNQFTEEDLATFPRAAAFLRDSEVFMYASELDFQSLPAFYMVDQADGYAIEMAIPFSKLIGRIPQVGDKLDMQIQNNDLDFDEDEPILYYSMNVPSAYYLGEGESTPEPEPLITVKDVSNGNGQSNIDFAIKSANGKGYSLFIKEIGTDDQFREHSKVNYNAKGAHVKGLTNGKTYHAYIVYSKDGVYEESDIAILKPLKSGK